MPESGDRPWWRLGTSSVVVAAFVGPGTVLTCASAGVNFGYALGWVLLFSTLSVFVLQSFTANTGILARRGLGEAVRETITAPGPRAVSFTLIVIGLWVGCAAFEMGNLIGAAAGITTLLELPMDDRWVVALIALLAGIILLLDLRVLVRVFAALVGGMSLLFLGGLVLTPVNWTAALVGLTVPSMPDGSLLTVVALIGTTVVTYNLFLHASVAKQYWADTVDAEAAWRREMTGMAIFLPVGGLISFAILATGATLFGIGARVDGVAAMARLLEPAAGSAAQLFFGLGLFAAGLTSTITAPLAAATGIQELFGWDDDPTGWAFRGVWASVLLTGCAFGLAGWSPLPAIVAAQAANGVLLPLIAAFVLYLSMQQDVVTLPGWYRVLGVAITLICAGLGARTLWWVAQQVGG
jgi:NRAMP (natural resistance-associated macrophage protein)-like metal ion transporter